MRYRLVRRFSGPAARQAPAQGAPAGGLAQGAARPGCPPPRDPDNPYARFYTAPRRFEDLCGRRRQR